MRIRLWIQHPLPLGWSEVGHINELQSLNTLHQTLHEEVNTSYQLPLSDATPSWISLKICGCNPPLQHARGSPPFPMPPLRGLH